MILTHILCLIFSFQINFIFTSNQFEDSFHNLFNNSLTNDYDFDNECEDQCSSDQIIDQMIGVFTPDDYEEGKQNIKYEFKTIEETLNALKGLDEYQQNVRQKMSEFIKRLSNRLSEVLMTIDLPQECMNPLVRITNSANDGQVWGLKCKCTWSFNIILCYICVYNDLNSH